MLKLTIVAMLVAVTMASGQWKEHVNPTPEALEMAEWSASAMSNGDFHQVIKVTNVKTQVVAGMRYKFTLEMLVNEKVTKVCEMSVFDQPWTKTRNFFEAPVCRASRTIVGGYVDTTVNEKALDLASWFAVQMSTLSATHTVTQVTNFQQQLVNGMNYKFNVNMMVNNKVERTCAVTVHEQFNGERSMIGEPKCFVKARQLGGWTNQEVDLKAYTLANWSAMTLTQQAGLVNPQFHYVLEVTNFQSQIVNGMNYKVTVNFMINNKTTRKCDITIHEVVGFNSDIFPIVGREFVGVPACQ